MEPVPAQRLPEVLDQVVSILEASREWAPTDAAIAGAERLLRQGWADPASTAPVSESPSDVGGMDWARLREAALLEQPEAIAARCSAAFSALAAVGEPAAIVIGADDVGGSGIAIGLPRGTPAMGAWLSGQAPDLIWEPGSPPGWSVLSDPCHSEQSLTCRPTDVEARPMTDGSVSLPVLTHLLAVPVPRWCVAMVLTPLPRAYLTAARDRVGDARAHASRRLTRSESSSDTVSQSVTDPRAQSVVQALGSWVELLDDCLHSGGWQVSVNVCAQGQAGLGAICSAFGWAMSQEATGAPSGRRQNWDAAGCASGGRPSVGWLSSKDLGSLLVPPLEATGDLLVRRSLPGGRRTLAAARPLNLGSWLGTTQPAVLDVDDLAGHAFVAGITGSGKSTTTGSLLAQLWNQHRVPFLVIDPAKADYERLSGALDGGLLVVPGAELAMNALAAWPGMPADRHISLVSTAFRAAFGMPVPVPYVASLLFEQLAIRAAAGTAVTLHDASAMLDSLVAELGYRGEIEDNIRASLGLRLRVLLQPQRAERVAGSGPPTWLSRQPTLIQLSDLGDDEERAFLTALLVLYIADAARSEGVSASVRHVTVVEEAHRLIPEPQAANSETGDAASVAARLFTHLLAEVRAYGEAVMVVDQSPAAVAREVLRNTNLKLAHRIVDSDDQASLGGALGLADKDTGILGSLTVGRCLVSSRNLVQPQSVQVDRLDLDTSTPDLRHLPDLPGAQCHRQQDALHHHASEAAGGPAELAVALWSASGAHLDLVDALRPVLADHPLARVSCLVSVGLRRHVSTAARLGQVSAAAAGPYVAAAWAAFLHRQRPPTLPGRPAAGPYPACANCPAPCRSRIVVASGALLQLRRGMAAASRAASASRIVDESLAAAEDCQVELTSQTGDDLATGIGYCVAVHVARASGAERALIARLKGSDTDAVQ